MNNPFELIEARLNNIETLILDLKHSPVKPDPSNPIDDLLTIEQAAVFLHLTKPTLYSKVSKGEVPFMKRSKRLYFSRIELMEYVKGGKQRTIEEVQADASEFLINKKG